MIERGHAQIRRSQAIMVYGPGALIDLPRDAAIGNRSPGSYFTSTVALSPSSMETSRATERR